MSLWQGKSKGTKLGYSIFVEILKRFGIGPAYFLLRFVALYYVLFSPKTSRVIFDFFHHKIGFGQIKSIRKLYRNYYLFGQSLIDKIVIMSGIQNRFTFNFDGEENLHHIVDLKRGGLLISAHIGNWEIAGFFLNRLESKINIVMYDGEHRQIKNYMEAVIGKRAWNIILVGSDNSHIFQISEALKKNELVCMHADRFVEDNRTITSDFLGEKAKFPLGPFLLASRLKVPVSFVFAIKEKPMHYHLYASSIQEYAQGDSDHAIEKMLRDFIVELENKVKSFPEQWYNYYPFWTS